MYVQETVGHRCRSLPSTRGEAPVRSRENFRSTTSVGDVRGCKGSRTARLSTQIRRRFGPLELSAPRETAPGVEVFWTYATECGNRRKIADRKPLRIKNLELEAPPGFEPGIEVLQLGTLPHSPREYIHLLTIHRVRLVPNSAQYGWMVPN